MFVLYILLSETTGKFYIGHTAELQVRLTRHNQGRSKSTASGIPWILFHFESFASRSDAMKREKQIKSWKSAERIRSLKGKHPA